MVSPRIVLAILFATSLGAQSPEALIRAGHLKRARAIVEAKFKENPRDPETLWLMSWIKQDWKDLRAAQDFAEKAVAADPKNARYHLRLADAVGEEAQNAGALRQLGLGKRFKKEIDITVSLEPNNIDALKYLVEFYFAAPGIMGGDKTKGLATVEQIARLDPVEGYFEQAKLARRDKQEDRIEPLYRKAVEARPSNYDARITLGNYCLGTKKPDEALVHAREAIKIDPGRVQGHALLTATLANLERWPELDAALAASEKSVPDDFQPYFRAGTACLSKSSELSRAERYFRKYLSEEPEPQMVTHARVHWRLGVVLERQGRKAEAIAELQTAIRMEPNSPAKDELKKLK